MEAKQPNQEKTISAQVPRTDPVNRPTDGGFGVRLLNSDKTRKYVFAYLGDTDNGADFYEELGYRREKFSPEPQALRIAGMKHSKTDFITFRGHVLMSIEREESEKIYRKGAVGAGLGQEHWDKREALIMDKSKFDPLRGVKGRNYMHLQNNISTSEETGRL